jgi:hypothetical protein
MKLFQTLFGSFGKSKKNNRKPKSKKNNRKTKKSKKSRRVYKMRGG